MVKQVTPGASAPRVRRSPLAGRSKLTVHNREDGYQYRIVNANLERDPERVQDFLDRGYELVPSSKVELEKTVDSIKPTGSTTELSVGLGTKAVVMRQRQDWYDEDQRIKMAQLDEQEAGIHRNADYGSVEIGSNRP